MLFDLVLRLAVAVGVGSVVGGEDKGPVADEECGAEVRRKESGRTVLLNGDRDLPVGVGI